MRIAPTGPLMKWMARRTPAANISQALAVSGFMRGPSFSLVASPFNFRMTRYCMAILFQKAGWTSCPQQLHADVCPQPHTIAQLDDQHPGWLDVAGTGQRSRINGFQVEVLQQAR